MPRYDPGTPTRTRKPRAPDPWPRQEYPDGPNRSPFEPGEKPLPAPRPGYPAPEQPPVPAPTPPPAPIDWNALVQQDPQYIAALAALTRERHDALVNYGDVGGIPGADPSTAAEAANNPYSVTHMLRQQLAMNQHNLANSANAHGVLFSGAETQNQQNESNNALQRSFSAAARLQSMLGGYADQQQAAYAAAYNRLSNPATVPGSPADPNAPADPNNTTPPAPAQNAYLPGAPASFKPPAAPKPLSHRPSVRTNRTVTGPRPPRATRVLPTRYG